MVKLDDGHSFHLAGSRLVHTLTLWILWFVPYERLQLNSRLDVDSARRKVQVFVASPQPTHLETDGRVTHYYLTGQVEGNSFRLASDSEGFEFRLGSFSFSPEERDADCAKIPFVLGKILPSSTGSLIQVTLRPSNRSLIADVLFFLVLFLLLQNLNIALGFSLVVYAFNLMSFKSASFGAKSILKVLFRVSKADTA